jgi:hypothetical protein
MLGWRGMSLDVFWCVFSDMRSHKYSPFAISPPFALCRPVYLPRHPCCAPPQQVFCSSPGHVRTLGYEQSDQVVTGPSLRSRCSQARPIRLRHRTARDAASISCMQCGCCPPLAAAPPPSHQLGLRPQSLSSPRCIEQNEQESHSRARTAFASDAHAVGTSITASSAAAHRDPRHARYLNTPVRACMAV